MIKRYDAFRLNEAEAELEKHFTDQVEGLGYSAEDYTPAAWRAIFFLLIRDGFTKGEAETIMKSKHTRYARVMARNNGKSENTLSTLADWKKYYLKNGPKELRAFLNKGRI